MEEAKLYAYCLQGDVKGAYNIFELNRIKA